MIPIRLALVDDSELVRMGLRTLLAPESTITIVAEAASVADCLQRLPPAKPDVVLMDIRLPDGTGFDASRRLLEMIPTIRVIVLTSVADDRMVNDAISSGAAGYLLKEINGPGLIKAIQDVAMGRSILDPSVTARVMKMVRSNGVPAPQDALSAQEARVLALVAEGKTNKEVGVSLGLSEKTVKNYLANVFDKLAVTRRSQAVAVYMSRKQD